MPRLVKTFLGSIALLIAGFALFFLCLIVIGAGPSWPRVPSQTLATVLHINRRSVSDDGRYLYVAYVQWKDKQGIHEQEEAWERNQANVSSGEVLPAVIFHATADPKLRWSGDRIAIGSLRNYWLRQGLFDWGLFWGH